MKSALFLTAVVGIAVVGCEPAERADIAPKPTVDAAGEKASARCPECGGALVKHGTVYDDLTKPSKNIAIWNRSSCANPFDDPNEPICTNCWLAYSETLERWERSSELPESFRRPLAAGIRECPLPAREEIKSRVVYSQEIDADGVQESVLFWCVDSAEYIAKVKSFAREHQLTCRVEMQGRIENQVCITVETKTAK